MKLGIIGGSGLYDIDNLEVLENISLSTPFGNPSQEFIRGKINDIELIFLSRHGKGHTISPSEINHRANIYGFKKLGVTHILSFSAVGSLKLELVPRDMVIIDQYYDRTKQIEKHTFFRNGIVAHVPFGDPICPELRELAYKIATKAVNEVYGKVDGDKPKAVNGGTYVNMEGPAFSTKAESNVYRSLGMDVIGMTSLIEAKLSREAEICYCSVAMITDYDCWHADHDHVSSDMVMKTMQSNVIVAKKIVSEIVSELKTLRGKCSCGNALKNAIVTSHDNISEENKVKLSPIIAKYIR